MADKETATYFRLGGIENSWIVSSADEASRLLKTSRTNTLYHW